MDEEADDALLCASGDVSDSEGSSEAPTAAGQVSCTVYPSHISCVGLSPAGHLPRIHYKAALALACFDGSLVCIHPANSYAKLCTGCGH